MKRHAIGSWLLLLAGLGVGAAQALDYKVKSGDTLSGIAARFGVSVDALKAQNGLSTSRIYPGDILTIPGTEAAPSPAAASGYGGASGAGTYEVRVNDTLGGIAARLGVSVDALRSANGLGSRATLIHPGQRLVVPAGGRTPAPAPVAAASPAPAPAEVPATSARRHAPMRVAESEVEVLARIVKGECWFDTPFEGMVAVAATVLNRVRSPAWPNSISRVALQPSQFSCYNPDNRRHLYEGPIPESAWRAARAALAGEDPSEGATHYYNPYLVRPRWARGMHETTRLGSNKRNTHVFFYCGN